MKKLLFSTTLTAIIATTSLAVAADAVHETKQKSHVSKTAHSMKKNAVHGKKVQRHNIDDTYHPSQRIEPRVQHNQQEATVSSRTSEKEVRLIGMPNPFSQRDSLINSDGVSVKVGGKVDIQYGVISQRKHFVNPSNGDGLPHNEVITPQSMPSFGVDGTQGKQFTNKQGLAANGKLEFTACKEDANGMKYGATIEANASASPSASGSKDIANKVFIFAENHIGRVEIGGEDGASTSMGISGASIAKATDGIDGDFGKWVPYTAVSDDATRSMLHHTFLTAPSLPYASQYAKKSNKITYYTPKVNGFNAGISYVPDTTVDGTAYKLLAFKGSGYKNVVEGGIGYEHKTNDMLFAISATGQVGDARDAYVTADASNGTTIPQRRMLQLEKLGAWQVGGKVEYKGMAAAASYGDWGKSGTLKQPLTITTKHKKEAKFWTAGLAYTADKAGVSVTYLGSERQGGFAMDALRYIAANEAAFNVAKNKFDAVSFGVEYKAMPGLVPYIEATTFEYKTPLKNVKTNRGTVVLGGVKLTF